MSNKTQLQTNNNNLDTLITRVNAAKDTAASLPEAGGGENLNEIIAQQEVLIGELSTILNNKSGNGDVSSIKTCQVIIKVEGESTFLNRVSVATCNQGVIGYEIDGFVEDEVVWTMIFNNVICGTPISVTAPNTSDCILDRASCVATLGDTYIFTVPEHRAGETAYITFI